MSFSPTWEKSSGLATVLKCLDPAYPVSGEPSHVKYSTGHTHSLSKITDRFYLLVYVCHSARFQTLGKKRKKHIRTAALDFSYKLYGHMP